jgi:hypothetical protein
VNQHRPQSLSALFKRGSTWAIALIRRDADGDPIDLSGLTSRAMFRKDSVDGEVLVTLDDSAGITIADPASGRIELEITPTDSVLFLSGTWVYFDVEQTDPAGRVWQSPSYRFFVSQEITRD